MCFVLKNINNVFCSQGYKQCDLFSRNINNVFVLKDINNVFCSKVYKQCVLFSRI